MMQASHYSKRKNQSEGRGFTLIELLVSLGIIFLLVTLTLYALKGARRAAGRSQSLNALHQMMVGYNQYSNENNGTLMPGYIKPSDFGAGKPFETLKVKLTGTKYELAPEDKASYVWRLAPYLDNAWQTFMTDYRDSSLIDRMAEEYGAGNNTGVYGPAGAVSPQFGISQRPAFGINSMYVGGDSEHGDQSSFPAPWNNMTIAAPGQPGRIAAVRQSEVRNPSQIIVFGATRSYDSENLKTTLKTSDSIGYPALWAPYAGFYRDTQQPTLEQWRFHVSSGEGVQIMLSGMGTPTNVGIPIDRSGNSYKDAAGVFNYVGDHKIPISHLDGSVGNEILEDLAPSDAPQGNPKTQMIRWSPFAVSVN